MSDAEYFTRSEMEDLRQQLDESEQQLTLWIEADNINRQQLAEANAARERAEAEAANLYKQRIDAKLRIEQLMAEAGVMRKALEEIAASTAGDDEPGDRSPRRAGWECVQVARAALASDTGEKAAAVIAAATEFWRDRTQRIGPLDPSVVDRLLAAVAAMEGIGDG